MCGRFSITHSWEDLSCYFRIQNQAKFSSPPRYNVASSQQVLVLRSTPDGKRYLSFLRWGLIPHWAKAERIGYKMINARSETAAKKPAFRSPLRFRRCVIPATSFFEWKKKGKTKTPFKIFLKTHAPLPLAGLWDTWKAPTGETIESCTILTTASNSLVATLHDRMPAILRPNDIPAWLSSEVREVQQILPLLRAYPAGLMEMYPVSEKVNSPANDDPECVAPV